MKCRILTIFLIMGLLAFAGCMDDSDNTTTTTTVPTTTTTTVPTTTTTLEKPDTSCFLMYDDQFILDVCYDEKQMEIDSLNMNMINVNSEISNVVSLDNYYFLITSNQLVKLDEDFNLQSSSHFDGIGSLSTDGENLFFSAGDSFFSLDSDLNEIGRLVLKHEGKKVDKRAHDILLDGNEAFLLDNIMMPLYTFRVDVSDPENMSITKSRRYQIINGHLDDQWIDPSKGLWTVVSSYGRQGGSGENLNTYSLDDSERVSGQTIYTNSGSPQDNVTIEGFRILANTKKPPLWALLYAPKNDSYDLARITYEDNKVSFDRVLDLQLSRSSGLKLYRKNDFLFLEVGFSIVKVIDPSKPEVVADLDIDGYIEDHYHVLFEVDLNSSLKESMNNGVIPSSLRKDFQENGHPLSQDAKIEVKNERGIWKITDGNNVYLAYGGKSSLEIVSKD